jgi:hypothetical protein
MGVFAVKCEVESSKLKVQSSNACVPQEHSECGIERSDIPLFRKSSWATAGRARLDFLEREWKVQMERKRHPAL